MTNRRYDIYDRSFRFAARVGLLVNKLPKYQAILEYGKQVIRSSASVGANLEEADGALTKRDFINKMAISRKEAKESRYWLRLIDGVGSINDIADRKELAWQIREAEELMLIISTIIKKQGANN